MPPPITQLTGPETLSVLKRELDAAVNRKKLPPHLFYRRDVSECRFVFTKQGASADQLLVLRDMVEDSRIGLRFGAAGHPIPPARHVVEGNRLELSGTAMETADTFLKWVRGGATRQAQHVLVLNGALIFAQWEKAENHVLTQVCFPVEDMPFDEFALREQCQFAMKFINGFAHLIGQDGFTRSMDVLINGKLKEHVPAGTHWTDLRDDFLKLIDRNEFDSMRGVMIDETGALVEKVRRSIEEWLKQKPPGRPFLPPDFVVLNAQTGTIGYLKDGLLIVCGTFPNNILTELIECELV